MRQYWLSCSKFTVQVNTDESGKIVWAAPITRKFVGQPLANLLRWCGPHKLVDITPDQASAFISEEKS